MGSMEVFLGVFICGLVTDSKVSIHRIPQGSRIVKKANLQSLTSRAVRQKLEVKLSLDLSSRKKEIDKLVMAEVEDQTNSQSEEEEEELSEEEAPPSRKKAAESDSDAEVDDVDDKDEDDDYSPKAAAKKGGRKPKPAGKKRKTQDDEDSDEDWNKPKNKKGAGAAAAAGGGGRGKKGSAFTRSFKLSPELADVVGSDVMPRHEVVKKLWAVIKERELQDPKNKQYAICDDQLMKVFGIKRFRTFGMMKHLKDHFLESV